MDSNSDFILNTRHLDLNSPIGINNIYLRYRCKTDACTHIFINNNTRIVGGLFYYDDNDEYSFKENFNIPLPIGKWELMGEQAPYKAPHENKHNTIIIKKIG